MLIMIAVSSTSVAVADRSKSSYGNVKTEPSAVSIFTIRKSKGFPKRTTTHNCIKLRNGSFDCTKKEYGKIK